MTEKIILDNLNGQEIKEMIKTEKIVLEALDASAISKLLDYETDMLCFGEGDMDLIDKCSNLLDIRNGGSIIPKETFVDAINKAKAECATAEATNRNNSISKPRIILKRIFVIAAVVAMLITSTVIIAAAFDINILEYLNQIVRQDSGSEINIDNFTFYHNGDTKKYSSIEELIEKENLDIMYPSKFPNDAQIEKIIVFKGKHSEKQIVILANDGNCTISVYVNWKKTEPILNCPETFTHNGLTFHINTDDNYAFCFYKNNYYSISAENYDDLITIIQNMKE